MLKSRRIRLDRFDAGWVLSRSRSLPNGARSRSTRRRPRSMVDFHGGGLAGGENDALGHMIDVDAHGNALRQPHPGEDRVEMRESLWAGLRIGGVHGACGGVEVAAGSVAVALQHD